MCLSAGCSPKTAQPDDGPITPPFVVSDHYAPTGYMGDGTVIGLVTQINDACPSRAPLSSELRDGGDCYKVTYTPQSSWAGIYWQYPANNWGKEPGRVILAGAKRLTVWARGQNGGEKLELHAGGLQSDNPAEFPYHDTLDASTEVTLTTDWQQFTVNFGPKTYDRVLGAFAWIARATPQQTGTTIVFYLDGIAWET